MRYIYEQSGWPHFTWDAHALARRLADVRHQQGRLLGQMQALGFALREEASLASLTEDVVKSSEIEGETLDREQVRSSLARRMGLPDGGLRPATREVEGIVEIMLDATQHFRKPLTRERLYGWQASLFPAGRSGMRKITVGQWRREADGPMQVVSGPVGREKVHFEAPRSHLISAEMGLFLDWFNHECAVDPVLKAGIAHLWFVTIHPFADGNGRIARAIADLCLAQSDGSAQRFYSMSAQIRRERRSYYAVLEATQKNGMNITKWLTWLSRAGDSRCVHNACQCAQQSKVLAIRARNTIERATAPRGGAAP